MTRLAGSFRSALIIAACFAFAQPLTAAAAQSPSRLVAENSSVDVKVGDRIERGAWSLSPSIEIDTYTLGIEGDEPVPFCFQSGSQSWCRDIAIGSSHDLVIHFQGRDYRTRVVGVRSEPAAIFDQAYQAAHRGRTTVLIPEAYELVNVALALTAFAQADDNLVYKDSDYYRDVLEYFRPVMNHPFVQALDRELQASVMRYFTLKMNGYAFEIDPQNRVTRSPVYNRTGFNGPNANDLLPHFALMQSFARDSNFHAFYERHRPLYDRQIAYYRDEVNIARMSEWLIRNFPSIPAYDHVKIVFSPLVAWNQSLTTIESNGFRELQPHVNFPHPHPSDQEYSPEANQLRNGAILFTEMNHGYINPTAEPYTDRILRAVANREYWATAGQSSDAYTGVALFNEMMNWGLVVLYYADLAPAAEFPRMKAGIDTMMTERRGFPRFAEFSTFLLDTYRARPAGTTLEAIYPRIVGWFEEQTPRPAPRPAA